MKVLMELSDILEQELEEVTRKGTIESTGELEWIYKAVDVLKDIETICAMREGGSKYSREGSYGSYDDGGSYRRGRAANGRYVSRESRDNYGRSERMSREGEKEKATSILTEMMQTANNERERDAIRDFLQNWGEMR